MARDHFFSAFNTQYICLRFYDCLKQKLCKKRF